LYERLKSKGVLVIPGESFFPGCDEAWSHRQECLRLSYAQDEAQVEKGLSILIQELQELYANKG
jgi:valine--pyruvate aminotransferase